jgi:hypothetical protein
LIITLKDTQDGGPNRSPTSTNKVAGIWFPGGDAMTRIIAPFPAGFAPKHDGTAKLVLKDAVQVQTMGPAAQLLVNE